MGIMPWQWWRRTPTFNVVGYDLRGREDDVRLAVSRARKMLFNLKYMIVDFSWREAKTVSECLGNETRAFFANGQLSGRCHAEHDECLARIAGDLAARSWPREKAQAAMIKAAQGHTLGLDVVAAVKRLIPPAYRQNPVLGHCTEPGRFEVVLATLCYGNKEHALTSNAVSKAGELVLVPRSFKLSEELTIAVQREVDDPKRNEFVQSVLEKQLREQRSTIDLLNGRKGFLKFEEADRRKH